MSSTVVGISSAAALLAVAGALFSVGIIIGDITSLENDIYTGMDQFKVFPPIPLSHLHPPSSDADR